MPKFNAFMAPQNVSNRFGYAQKVPPGSWLISDEYGYPVRVHNGFAVFTTAEQAQWCAEMARDAFEAGRDAMRAELRALLGIENPTEGND